MYKKWDLLKKKRNISQYNCSTEHLKIECKIKLINLKYIILRKHILKYV